MYVFLPQINEEALMEISQLSLVDMAGSERTSRTGKIFFTNLIINLYGIVGTLMLIVIFVPRKHWRQIERRWQNQ